MIAAVDGAAWQSAFSSGGMTLPPQFIPPSGKKYGIAGRRRAKFPTPSPGWIHFWAQGS